MQCEVETYGEVSRGRQGISVRRVALPVSVTHMQTQNYLP